MIKNVVEEEIKWTIKKNQMYRDGKDLTEFFFENKEIWWDSIIFSTFYLPIANNTLRKL